MKISIISGSTREGRNSHRLALALRNWIGQQGHEAVIIDLKELALPPFSERLQFMAEKPAQLVAVSEIMQTSNAIIFLTPEYNGGYSSALKGFIDIFGRPEFGGKPIGVATASTGVMGGIRAAHQLQLLILGIQAYPQPQMLLAGEVHKQLDEQGALINPDFEKKLTAFGGALLGFAQRFVGKA